MCVQEEHPLHKQVNVYSAAVARACESVFGARTVEREFDATCVVINKVGVGKGQRVKRKKVVVCSRTERGVIIFRNSRQRGGKTPDEFFGAGKFFELTGKELAEVGIIVGRGRTE